MNAIWTIATKEWREMFQTPLAWTVLGIFFAITAYIFRGGVVSYQLSQMQFQTYGMDQAQSLTNWAVMPIFANGSVLLLLMMPLLTMRLIATEKQNETWPAIVSSPITPWQIILGKYLGLLFFLAIITVLLAILPLTLYPYGNPDTGQILAAFLGFFLLAASFGAVGLAASSATEKPMVAAMITFGILLMLWIISMVGQSGGGGSPVLDYLSIINHYYQFLQGIVTTTDISYFVLLSASGLTFARHRLLAEKIRG